MTVVHKKRHNTKHSMSSTAFKFTEIPIPQEIVNSGDYFSAENILANEKVPERILAERFYRLGNSFYSAAQNQAAEMAWQKSVLLADQPPKVSAPNRNFSNFLPAIQLPENILFGMSGGIPVDRFRGQ